MKITLLGTGSFISLPGHQFGQGYLLEVGNKKILVDAGPGIQFQLLKIGVKVSDLDYIFITHFHADHTTELFAMLFGQRMKTVFFGEKTKKISIYGPPGIKKFIRDLGKAYMLEGLNNYKFFKYFKVKKEIKLGGFKVNAFKVKHFQDPAYCYRFTYKRKSVCFSGDTIKCRGLIECVKDADLVVMDASFPATIKDNPAHLNTEEIGEIAQREKVKKLVLTHITPESKGINLIKEVRSLYKGKVISGKDLMKIKV